MRKSWHGAEGATPFLALFHEKISEKHFKKFSKIFFLEILEKIFFEKNIFSGKIFEKKLTIIFFKKNISELTRT